MSTPAPTLAPSTFDTPTALSGLYLWLLFGFFTSLLGCDLQRLVSQNMYIKHLLALVCFFFLFTVLDPANSTNVFQTWLKTLLVYGLFVMSTKSKAWASIAVVLLLIVDQTIKMHMNYISNNEDTSSESTRNKLNKFKQIRRALYASIVVIIVAGFIHYYMYQKSEYGDQFDFTAYLFGVPKCRDM